MKQPKLTKPEILVLETLWSKGPLSIREIQESLSGPKRLAYTSVQTMVYRLEIKKAVRRSKKISNAHIFEAVVSRAATQKRLIDELLDFFGGKTQLVMAHLVDSGKLTLEDVHEAERSLQELTAKEKRS